MARCCYISFKTEDLDYKDMLQGMDINMIDKSLNEAIESDDEGYIMRKIREEYLSGSTVTIHLIGNRNAEVLGYEEQKFIKRELQASLYNGIGTSRSGILGIVLPHMEQEIYKGTYPCPRCGLQHNYVNINESTTVSEFHHNYYIPNDKCAHSEDDRYCVLVKWDDFAENPEVYIEQAFLKRSHPISGKVKVRP